MHVSPKGPATYYTRNTKSLCPKVRYVILLLPWRFYYYPLYKVNEVGHDGVAYVTVFLDIQKPEHSERSRTPDKTYLNVM